MAHWAKIVFTVLYVVGLLIKIAQVNEPRKPVTVNEALGAMVETALCLWMIWGTQP